jgi:Nucleotidyl transferase AbiEii toxin, Type IV TA system
MKRGMAGSKHTVMPLSEIQLRTATIILALPEAAGFALAGGAALVIHEIVDRGTKDLDCFGPSTEAVNQLVDPSLAALVAAGLRTQLLLRADGFSKIVVTDDHERTQVDLGFDPASHDPVQFAIGPVRHLSDLAGDKLLALFSRAAARDFIDVAALLRRFTKSELCAIAASKDQGFNIDVLADGFGVLPTYDRDDEYPTLNDDDYHALTATFAAWQREIRQG